MTQETKTRRPQNFDPDAGIRHDWGIANHSLTRPNPPLHIVHREGSVYKTWCGGGIAQEGLRNITGRQCSKCLTLAYEEHLEYSD